MNGLIDTSTMQAINNASRAASLAVASIPTGVFQQIAQAQQQLIAYVEPIRQALAAFQDHFQKMWERIREAVNGMAKAVTFAFSTRPIYFVQPRPVVRESQSDEHLEVATNGYGFFVIGGKKLDILHPSSSRCGRLLAALLKRRAALVDYDELQAAVGSGDLRKTFKDLKYQLKKQGYRFEYELARTHGIAFIGISRQ